MNVIETDMKTVLVVDDDPSICEFINVLLTKEDFQVISTFRSRETLNLLRSGSYLKFDLMITDLQMPGYGGYSIIKDMQKEVGVVVPSAGERWREVTETDEHGHTKTRQVHSLGDSVVRVHERHYISAIDETGPRGRGMYFLAELICDREPKSIEEAFDLLKPKVVREAEERGAHVRRQGEWFAIPTNARTRELMDDVARGIAAYRQLHVLGRDGHHQLEEAVIYRAGDRKGEVYARGVLKHTKNEHQDLNLGTIRWHLIVHNVTGAAYTLGGGAQAQFD